MSLFGAMPLYYFDLRDKDGFFPDDEVIWITGDLDVARAEAFAALTDYARELKPTAERRRVAVEVSDKNRKPLFKVVLILEIEVVSP